MKTTDEGQRYRYFFGTAEFDEARFELHVDQRLVTVERKPLEVLLVLLRHDGDVVTRKELRELLWPRIDPVDYVMANAIGKLRRALGTNKDLIVTQPRIGVRLALNPQRVAVGSGYAAQGSARLRVSIQNAHSSLNEVEKAIAEGKLAVEAAIKSSGPLSEFALGARMQLAADLARGARYDESATALEQIESDLASDASHRPLAWARLWWVRSDLQAYRLELQASQESAEKACELLALGKDPDSRLADGIRMRLGIARRMIGDSAGSAGVFRELIAIQESRDGAGAETTQQSRVALARSLMFQSRNAEALEMARGASKRLATLLGPDNLATQHANDAIASIQFKMEDYVGAAATWQVVVSALGLLSARPTDFAVTAQANVALAFLYAGKPVESELAGRSALEMCNAILRVDSSRAQSIRYQLVFCLLDQGKTVGVGELLKGLDPTSLKQAIQAEDWEARIAYQRGRLAFFEGRFKEALSFLENADRILVEKKSKGLVSMAAVRQWIARVRQEVRTKPQ